MFIHFKKIANTLFVRERLNWQKTVLFAVACNRIIF